MPRRTCGRASCPLLHPPTPPTPPCDRQAVGGCGVRNSVVHALAGLPAVFTLQLRWPSRHEAADAVAGALAALDDKVGRWPVWECN